MKKNITYWDYVKSVFMNRWNLLGLFALTTAGFILNIPDVATPLIAAAEIAFLVTVAGNKRYQRAMNARLYADADKRIIESTNRKLKRILDSLGMDEKERFDNLRNRCIKLRNITDDISKPEMSVIETEKLRSSGIDKLLWLFLKLLYSKNSLERFFQTTTRESIMNSISKMEQQLSEIKNNVKKVSVRVQKSIQDNLETSKMRLRNFDLAKENYNFILLELDRLENKISSILEVSINRQDPDYILNEVDSISQSVQETERTIGELDFLTGLGVEDDHVPPVLQMNQPNRTR